MQKSSEFQLIFSFHSNQIESEPPKKESKDVEVKTVSDKRNGAAESDSSCDKTDDTETANDVQSSNAVPQNNKNGKSNNNAKKNKKNAKGKIQHCETKCFSSTCGCFHIHSRT